MNKMKLRLFIHQFRISYIPSEYCVSHFQSYEEFLGFIIHSIIGYDDGRFTGNPRNLDDKNIKKNMVSQNQSMNHGIVY